MGRPDRMAARGGQAGYTRLLRHSENRCNSTATTQSSSRQKRLKSAAFATNTAWSPARSARFGQRSREFAARNFDPSGTEREGRSRSSVSSHELSASANSRSGLLSWPFEPPPWPAPMLLSTATCRDGCQHELSGHAAPWTIMPAITPATMHSDRRMTPDG